MYNINTFMHVNIAMYYLLYFDTDGSVSIVSESAAGRVHDGTCTVKLNKKEYEGKVMAYGKIKVIFT